jgi:hypothetical protein
MRETDHSYKLASFTTQQSVLIFVMPPQLRTSWTQTSVLEVLDSERALRWPRSSEEVHKTHCTGPRELLLIVWMHINYVDLLS